MARLFRRPPAPAGVVSVIIDVHVHVLPDRLAPMLERMAGAERLGQFRRNIRSWLRPWSAALHRTQTFLRHLPEPARRRIDEIGPIVPLPNLLVESNATDLAEAMSAAGVGAAVVIAHPP